MRYFAEHVSHKHLYLVPETAYEYERSKEYRIVYRAHAAEHAHRLKPEIEHGYSERTDKCAECVVYKPGQEESDERRYYVGEKRTCRLQRRGDYHKRILCCVYGASKPEQYARHNIADDNILFFVYADIYCRTLIAGEQSRLPSHDRKFIVTEV